MSTPIKVTKDDQSMKHLPQWVENACTVEHRGNTYTAGGAFRVGTRALVYVSSDDKTVSTWRGDRVGMIVSREKIRLGQWSPMCGFTLTAYRVVMDDDRSVWYGRGGGPCLCLSLRMTKASQRILEARNA